MSTNQTRNYFAQPPPHAFPSNQLELAPECAPSYLLSSQGPGSPPHRCRAPPGSVLVHCRHSDIAFGCSPHQHSPLGTGRYRWHSAPSLNSPRGSAAPHSPRLCRALHRHTPRPRRALGNCSLSGTGARSSHLRCIRCHKYTGRRHTRPGWSSPVGSRALSSSCQTNLHCRRSHRTRS